MVKSSSALQIIFLQKTTNVLSLTPYYRWDLNSNLPDLVFHFWSGQNSENAGAVVSGGSPNRLVVLLSNGDGTYSDGTFTLTQSDNPIQLDGVSRKSLDHDFNADGYQDIFFAINREDGRSGQPPETNNAFSAAILSAGNGQYEIKNLGIENWYHSIGIIPSDTGVEVWLGGLIRKARDRISEMQQFNSLVALDISWVTHRQVFHLLFKFLVTQILLQQYPIF